MLSLCHPRPSYSLSLSLSVCAHTLCAGVAGDSLTSPSFWARARWTSISSSTMPSRRRSGWKLRSKACRAAASRCSCRSSRPWPPTAPPPAASTRSGRPRPVRVCVHLRASLSLSVSLPVGPCVRVGGSDMVVVVVVGGSVHSTGLLGAPRFLAAACRLGRAGTKGRAHEAQAGWLRVRRRVAVVHVVRLRLRPWHHHLARNYHAPYQWRHCTRPTQRERTATVPRAPWRRVRGRRVPGRAWSGKRTTSGAWASASSSSAEATI
jgi:hypothetical protein